MRDGHNCNKKFGFVEAQFVFGDVRDHMCERDCVILRDFDSVFEEFS